MNRPSHAFFLPAGAGRTGQRLCLYHAPHAEKPRGAVVYVHPFAEEMNKSRRMAALQSRALAEHGFAVLQIDLLGCGDSSGDFSDATWDDWVADVVAACAWLRERVDAPPWLWGLRAGALIACEAAAHLDAGCNFIFWQPALSGSQLLQQFLRLAAAANLEGRQGKAVIEGLRERLASGHKVEIAGYTLAPGLAHGLQRAALRPPLHPARTWWFEAGAREEPVLSPASLEMLAPWRAAGHDVCPRAVRGPMFWQTSEIEVAPTLLAATLDAMTAATAG